MGAAAARHSATYEKLKITGTCAPKRSKPRAVLSCFEVVVRPLVEPLTLPVEGEGLGRTNNGSLTFLKLETYMTVLTEIAAAAGPVVTALGLLLWRPIARVRADAKLADRLIEAAVALANDMRKAELTVNDAVLDEYKHCRSLAEQRFSEDRRLSKGLDAYKRLHDERGEIRRLLGSLRSFEKKQGKEKLAELLGTIEDTFGRLARFKR